MKPGRTRSTEGAVYAEFLIAFMPMLTFFLGLVQLILLHAAHVTVKHAAVKAARAAVVVLFDDPKHYGEPVRIAAPGSRRRAAIEAVAQMVMAPLGGQRPSVQMKDIYGRDDLVDVTVGYDFRCAIPLGKNLICGLDGITHIKASAALPNQGADYTY